MDGKLALGRAGGLEERKLGRTPIWESSDKLVLTFVLGWLQKSNQG